MHLERERMVYVEYSPIKNMDVPHKRYDEQLEKNPYENMIHVYTLMNGFSLQFNVLHQLLYTLLPLID